MSFNQTTMFHPINYLAWMRENMNRAQINLGVSNVRPLPPEEARFVYTEFDYTFFGRKPILAEVIAERYGVSPNCVVPTIGATMGFYIALSAIIDRGDEVLLEVPNYEPLYAVLRNLRATTKILERAFERSFEVDIEDLQRLISKSTKAVVLTNLHNPSGVEIPYEKMKAIAQIAREKKCFVLVDEVYLEASFTENVKPAASIADNVVSVASFSKAYGLDGLKVGWVVTRNERTAEKIRSIFNDYVAGEFPTPLDKIGAAVFKNRAKLLERTRRICSENLRALERWVAGEKGIGWARPAGGTVSFIHLPAGVDAMRLTQVLLEKYGTLVVPGDFFWMKGFVRLSFGYETERFVEGLQNISRALAQLRR